MTAPAPTASARTARSARHWWSPIALGIAIALLIVAPLVPGILSTGSALALVRVPVESLVILLVLMVVPWRWVRIVLAAVFGTVVVVAIALAGIDYGYEQVLDIHFDPADWQQLDDALGVVSDSIGTTATTALVVLAIVLAVALVVALTWAALRVSAGIRRHLKVGTAVISAVTAAWIVAALVGSQLVAGQPTAAAASVDAIGTAVSQVSTTLSAQAGLPRQIADDSFAGEPASDLLTALRGKDVVFAFVESYGQVAVQGTDFSPGVDAVLRNGNAQLKAEGYTAQSAWLTSPTFGGLSWLAHSTLQTGLWVDEQPIYSKVVRSDRFTLSDAFRKAGWRTVSDVPSDAQPWSFGRSFYHYDSLLNAQNVGYEGPHFGYARIPDQYTWKYFADHELTGPHKPVMAEIDLVSSHTPWAPLPQIVPWSQIGDGSIYAPQPAQSESSGTVWQNPKTVQQFYGKSVQYTLQSMYSFLKNVDDPNLVVIELGDHQPATIVSGKGANHEVPISIIAKDPAVFRSIAAWHWSSGIQPTSASPLWRMDAFRDRFLTAYGR
ncbi:sulfatase [Planctomonas sp. JC2975]|uniref:sulfatase n=1 Tax=Planctomonas sp. JC2975 TaxID=2729626 RepID=UPI001475347C|nr:sulfatase [Planctomonas sp. JC2975]NNC13606.1 sulfatase [Planctomonas sp. JC2975]